MSIRSDTKGDVIDLLVLLLPVTVAAAHLIWQIRASRKNRHFEVRAEIESMASLGSRDGAYRAVLRVENVAGSATSPERRQAVASEGPSALTPTLVPVEKSRSARQEQPSHGAAESKAGKTRTRTSATRVGEHLSREAIVEANLATAVVVTPPPRSGWPHRY